MRRLACRKAVAYVPECYNITFAGRKMKSLTFMGASATHRLLVAAACIVVLWFAVFWALA